MKCIWRIMITWLHIDSWVGTVWVQMKWVRQKIAEKKISPSGNWTRVTRVTGRYTDHYTNEDFISILPNPLIKDTHFTLLLKHTHASNNEDPLYWTFTQQTSQTSLSFVHTHRFLHTRNKLKLLHPTISLRIPPCIVFASSRHTTNVPWNGGQTSVELYDCGKERKCARNLALSDWLI